MKRVGRQIMKGSDSSPMLFLPVQADHTFQIGRKTLHADPTRAVLVAPDHHYLSQTPDGEFPGLRLDPDLLRRGIYERLRHRSGALRQDLDARRWAAG
jgi:hypothetical protein